MVGASTGPCGNPIAHTIETSTGSTTDEYFITDGAKTWMKFYHLGNSEISQKLSLWNLQEHLSLAADGWAQSLGMDK